MTTTKADAPDRRPAFLVDDDHGLDYIRDVETHHGWFSRCGDAYVFKHANRDGRPHDVWVQIPAAWVNDTELFGDYEGPAELILDRAGLTVERWFPGTTAAGHRYNAKARWYVRIAVDVATFQQAKAIVAHAVKQITAR